MIDMKCKQEAKTMLGEVSEDSKPEYPYGLRINLDNGTLEKLGMSTLPEIDAEFKVTALACVVSVSQNESQGSDAPYRSVELQIEMMEIKAAKEEPGEAESSAQRLYAKSAMRA